MSDRDIDASADRGDREPLLPAAPPHPGRLSRVATGQTIVMHSKGGHAERALVVELGPATFVVLRRYSRGPLGWIAMQSHYGDAGLRPYTDGDEGWPLWNPTNYVTAAEEPLEADAGTIARVRQHYGV